MYIEYWRFKEKPFENAAGTRYAYLAAQHKEGLARLLYVAKERKAGAILTGGCGTGKTMVRRVLLDRLGEVGNFVVAMVDNPLGEPRELIQDIYDQIVGKPTAFSTFGAAMRELRAALQARQSRGFHNIVMIEEAHLLNDSRRLEQIRLVTNLQGDADAALVSVLLFGQMELVPLLKTCPSLLQRMPCRWSLAPLTRDQTRAYIDHRLSVAGGNAWVFEDPAVEAIHEFTGGVPREINNVCDIALYVGMTSDAVRVDAGIVRDVLNDWGTDVTQVEGQARANRN
jgi:general secretion pathway protein A